MIVKRYWYKRTLATRTNYMGIFLLGFIPLYIEEVKND